MSNELLLILFTFFNLFVVLACYKMGRRFLELYIIVATVSLYCVAGKLFSFFGFTTGPAISAYAGIFLATDMLTEKYGKKAGYHMIRIGFLSAILFMSITQISLFFTPMPFVDNLSNSMDVVFGTSLRIFIASIIAYVIAQHFDVWFYHFLHQKTGDKFLWIRNNFSTGISQFIDSVLFFSIAFYGVIPNLFALMMTGYVMKLCIALLDTPFMYWSKKMTPLDHREKDVM